MTTRDLLDFAYKNSSLTLEKPSTIANPDMTLLMTSEQHGNIYHSEYIGGRFYVSPSGEWYELQECRDILTVIFHYNRATYTETIIDWIVEDCEPLTPEILHSYTAEWEDKLETLTKCIRFALRNNIVPGETVEQSIARSVMQYTNGLSSITSHH